jgi:hypothetical protein
LRHAGATVRDAGGLASTWDAKKQALLQTKKISRTGRIDALSYCFAWRMTSPQVAPMQGPLHEPVASEPLQPGRPMQPRRAQSQPGERVLYQLAARDLNSRWLARSARLMAWVLTGYTSVPYLFISTKSAILGRSVIWENLVTLSWLAGFAALVVAAPVAASSTAPLARLRGVSNEALSRVEWAAACGVPFKVLAPQGLIISALATAHATSWGDVARGLLTVLAIAGYLLVAAGVLGLCALWARRLSPTRGRTLFTLVMLIPMLLEHAQVMKSIPSLLNGLLLTCMSLAGGAP